ncbi:MAG: ScbA/BarX family gamma-butyrolactone biosynthesis protein [Dermatophilaceae bacterium]
MDAVGAATAPLDYSCTVDRTLVHRRSLAEVFITDLAGSEGHTIRAAAQWPRQHPYFDTGDGVYCLLLGAETFRQATIAGLHQAGLAALDDQFVMKRMGVAWIGEPPRIGDRPLDLVVTVRMTPTGPRGRYDLQVTVADAGRDLMTGWGVVVMLRPAVYAALRRGRTEPGIRTDGDATLDHAAVSRTRARDVVLAGSENGPWDLRVDTRHPSLFDHPADHVPGMLLFEAARQAALLTTGGQRVVSVGADFDAYVELDEPATVDLARADDSLVVTVRQGGADGVRVVVSTAS